MGKGEGGAGAGEVGRDFCLLLRFHLPYGKKKKNPSQGIFPSYPSKGSRNKAASSSSFFFFFVLLGPHPWRMEILRLGFESEL